MAYMDQTKKAALAPAIKAALKKFGLKGSISVRHHSTLVVTITSGEIDFISNFADCARAANRECGVETAVRDKHIQVNPYWLETSFTDRALEALEAIKAAMSKGNHDRSDIQTDYFDTGWYININVGKWDKPYVVTN